MAKKIIIVPLLLCFCMGLGLFSTLVWGQSEMPIPTSKPLPHEYVRLLGDAVDTLVAQKVLNPGQGTSLNRKLSLAKSELIKGNALLAIRHLESFSQETQGLLQARVLNSTQGQFLIAGSVAAQERINSLAFGLCFTDKSPVSWSLLPCGERPACRYTTYHVNMGLHIQGARKGSQEAPFNTINEALQRAAVLRLCGVEVLVATGHYIEDLVISRDTQIRGLDSRDRVVIVGSIVNHGGYELSVENLTISSSRAPGAIVVTAPCANTTITGVTIDRAERYGIYQRGGTLKVIASEIRRTRALADAVSAGTGIYLTGGVQAILGLVIVDGNDSGGLFAEGAQTRVYAAAVAVTDNSINPYFLDQMSIDNVGGAAVTAQDGALLLMEFCTINGNQNTGLWICGGARAHFRYGTISHTSAVPWPGHRYPLGGTNVIAQDATVELSNFTVSYAHLAGLIIAGSYVTASDGEVSYDAVGVYFTENVPNFDINDALSCLQDGVSYIRNGLDLQSEHLPAPCLGPCPPGVCRRVPFSCEWCPQGN